MKLQIVEYSAPNMLEGNRHYRYMLELDEKGILWTQPAPTKKELKQVYNILLDKMLDYNIDYYMEHFVTPTKLPGIERQVIFETEVSDAYFKELYIEKRKKAIEKDFKPIESLN
jgi:hypothetical protein